MKENSIKPYCYCGESESSLVDNAIFVYFGDEYRRVLLDEILWLEASGSYCVLCMENGAEITVSYPLDRIFNNDLPRGKFQRIHRSYPMTGCTHLAMSVKVPVYVSMVTGFAGNYVHIGKKMLPVSESHKKNFLACFHKIYSKRALGK